MPNIQILQSSISKCCHILGFPRDRGFCGDAMVNFVSLVGGGFGAAREHRDELYKKRSSRKIDSRRLFSREWDFPKTFSLTENQFSGKTYFCTIRPCSAADIAPKSPAITESVGEVSSGGIHI